MNNSQFLFQMLPVLTIILGTLFFVVYKILSHYKSQATGIQEGGKATELKLVAPEKMPAVERVKLGCPAVIERSQGFTKVGIKEISLNGAFVTCPRPLALGETFQIKIIFSRDKSLVLQADVLWNNNNVPRDRVVARGMKVGFLRLTNEQRQFLKEIVSPA